MSGGGDGPASPAVQTLKTHMQAVKKELDEYTDKHRYNLEQIELEKLKMEEVSNDSATVNKKLAELEAEYAALTARLESATTELQTTIKRADEFERSRRALDHRRNMDEERIGVLEQMLKETSDAAFESDKKSDEVTRKLFADEDKLQSSEGKTEAAEQKAKQIQADMHALTSKLKSFQSTVEKYSDREEKYERTIEDLKARIKNAVSRASSSDEMVAKLQRESEHLKDELNQTKVQYHSLREQLDPYSSGRK